MPHSSKKTKKQEIKPSRNNSYVTIAVVAIIAIIAGAGGWYVYSSSHGVTTTTVPTTLCGNVLTTMTTESANVSNYVYAIINTSCGSMEVELFKNATPVTVNNFVSLVNSGFYDNLVWHRIVYGFVIQTGDPQTRNGGGNRVDWGNTGSNTTIPLEIVHSLHNYEGYLGMARGSSNNSGSSQFYINLNNTNAQNLDGKYTVFGKVISGMDVALAIGNVRVDSNDAPTPNIFVTNITIVPNS